MKILGLDSLLYYNMQRTILQEISKRPELLNQSGDNCLSGMKAAGNEVISSRNLFGKAEP